MKSIQPKSFLFLFSALIGLVFVLPSQLAAGKIEPWLYRNQQYGFEFKYPKDWKIVVDEDGGQSRYSSFSGQNCIKDFFSVTIGNGGFIVDNRFHLNTFSVFVVSLDQIQAIGKMEYAKYDSHSSVWVPLNADKGMCPQELTVGSEDITAYAGGFSSMSSSVSGGRLIFTNKGYGIEIVVSYERQNPAVNAAIEEILSSFKLAEGINFKKAACVGK